MLSSSPLSGPPSETRSGLWVTAAKSSSDNNVVTIYILLASGFRDVLNINRNTEQKDTSMMLLPCIDQPTNYGIYFWRKSIGFTMAFIPLFFAAVVFIRLRVICIIFEHERSSLNFVTDKLYVISHRRIMGAITVSDTVNV